MATQHNFRIKNGLEVGGVLIVNSSGQLQAASISGAISATSIGVTNIVTNKVVKFNGSILDDSNITDTGSLITLGSNTTVSGTISSGAITSTGLVTSVGGVINTNTGSNPFYVTRSGATNQALKIYTDDAGAVFESIQDETADNYGTFIFAMDSGTTEPFFDVRKGTAASGSKFRVDGSGALQVGSSNTTFLDASLNLTNIGTISSGAITSSGSLTLSSNGISVNTRSLLARDTNGLNIGTTNATTAISIDNSANVTMPYNLTVSGNLTINGTTTTLNTATLDVEDKNITLNYGAGDTSGSANGAGITIQDAVNSTTDATILWNAGSDQFDFSNKINVSGDLQASNIYALDVHVLNAAGNGWHEWATRNNNKVDLNVGTISSGILSVNGGTTNVVATFQSTDGTAGIKLQDSAGNVELSASGSTFQVQPSGGSAVFTVNSSGNASFSGTVTATGGNSTNWNTAYGWGNHASAGYITDGNTNWNNSYGFITNTSGTAKGTGNNYVASSTSTSNRGNYGAGVWAYSGYSTGSNRPFTYDSTLQVMPASNMGFELSTDWHSSSGQLKIRSLRDCCQGWSTYSTVWTSASDGSGSGLDADLLDGQQGSYYYSSANPPPTYSKYLRSDTADTGSGKITLTATEGLQVGGIRGRAIGSQSGDFIQLYERVNIGYPSGWGATGANAPQQGLSTHGGAQFNTGNVSGAPFTFNSNTIWHAGNDGSGSGLDADLLDGQHGSYYYSSANPPPGEADTLATVTARGASTSTALTFNADTVHSQIRFTGVSGNSGVAHDGYAIYQEAGSWTHPYPDLIIGYHTGIKIGGHTSYGGTRFYNNNPSNGSIIASIGNGDNHLRGYHEGYLRHGGSTDNKIWTAGNDGAGSGLDADLLDGQHGSYYYAASNPSGYTTYTANQSLNTTNSPTFANLNTTNTGYVGIGDDIRIKDVSMANTAGIVGQQNNDRGYLTFGNNTTQLGRIGTGALTWGGNTIWHSGNDGAGSGLDADTIDGFSRINHLGVGELQNFSVGGDADTWYPVVISGGGDAQVSNFQVYRGYGETAPSTWNTASHKGGLSFKYSIVGSSGWGGYPTSIRVQEFGEIYSRVLGGIAFTAHTMKHVVWLRGGTANYHIYSDSDISVEVNDSTSASNYVSASPHKWYSYDNSNNAYDVTVSERTSAEANTGVANEVYLNMPVQYNSAGTPSVYGIATSSFNHKFWNSSNDGSGSGLDADLLDGQHGSYYLAYGNLTGTPTIPSLSGYATESYVGTQISNLVDSSPAALNTLNELAAAIGDDANFSTTVTNNIATKAPLASPTFTTKITTPSIHNTGKISILNGSSAQGIRVGSLYAGTTYAADGSASGMVDTLNGYRVQGNQVIDSSGNWVGGGNISEFTNNSGYITDGNTNWNNSYGFITSSDSSITSKLPLAGGTLTGGLGGTTASFSSNLTALNHIVTAGDGNKIGFWGGTGSYAIWMASSGSGGRQAYEPNSDYNMYFRMGGGTNRGFVFQTGSSSKVGIDSLGNIRADGVISSNNRQAMNCVHWSASGTSTGAVKITLPGSAGSVHSMPIIKIYTYQYSGTAHVVYTISGHDWSTASNWYNTRVTAEGGPPLAVRLGHDGTNYCIIIGETNTSWSYGSATVELKAHPSYYAANQNFTTGWGATQITTMPSTVTAQTVGKIWDSSNDGSGSGLDADLLDGMNSSSSVVANTIVARQANGYIYANHINFSTSEGENPTINSFFTSNGDGWSRKSTKAHVISQLGLYTTSNDGSGSGLDADLLDGLNSSSLLRSDADDAYDGILTMNGMQFRQSNVNRNLKIQGTSGGSDVGISGFRSDGTHGFQLYADGTNYGFLDGNWAGWDIQKVKNGTFKVDEGAGLKRVLNEANWSSYITLPTDANTIDGIGFVNTGSNSAQNSDNIDSNGISYYTSGVSNFSGNATDGALYSQRYSSSWQHQIAGDYRSGQIALRGRNNGTWTSWNKVWTAGNDGSGSGLDADLLDGLHASSFLRSDAQATTSGSLVIAEDWGSGTYSSAFVIQGSHPSWETRGNASQPYGWLHHQDSTGHYTLYSIAGYTGNSWTQRYTFKTDGSFRNGGTSGHVYYHQGNDGSGSGLDADLLDGQHGSYYLNAANFTGTAPTGSPFLSNFVHLGNSTATGYATDDGSWGSRLNVSSTVHAKIEVSQEANSMRSAWYAHTGQTGIKFGTTTGHVVDFITAGSVRMSIPSNSGVVTTSGQGTLWGSSNDGSGSGLDADLLDGIQAGRIVYASGTNAMGTSRVGFAGLTNSRSGFYDVSSSGTPTATWYSLVNMAHSSTNHGHQIAGSFYSAGDIYNRNNNNTTLSAWAKIWNTANDGAGSGLDADLLDGYNTSTSATANTVVVREGSGHIYGNYILGSYFNASSGNSENPTIGQIWTQSTGDNYLRKSTPAHFVSQLNLVQTDGSNPAFVKVPANYTGNLNSISNAGVYFTEATGSVSNNPFSSSGSFLQLGDAGGVDVRLQFYAKSSLDRIAFRNQWGNGNWGGWHEFWTTQNDGSGSGLDADLLDGLQLHTGRNNEANKVVRTQANGYIDCGWINTLSGDSGLANDVVRIYCSNDGYLRYLGKSDFKVLMGLPKNTYDRRDDNSNAAYHTGALSYGVENMNNLFNKGSGFIDVWGSPTGKPPAGSHYNGFQALHYSASNTYHHGMQMVMSAGNPSFTYLRGWWANGGSGYAWQKIWTDGNDGSGSGLDADLLDGYNAEEGAVNNSIVKRDGNAEIQVKKLHLTGGNYEGSIVFGTQNDWHTGIRQHDDGDAEMRIWAKNSNGRIHIATGYDGEPASIARPTDGFVLNANNVGIGNFNGDDPSQKLHVKGNILASGNITAYSDEKLKDNVQVIKNAVEKVKQIRGVTFTRNDLEDQERHTGVIAQEVEKVLPEVIGYDEDRDTKTVAYGNMVGLLVEAIKEQQELINKLTSRLDDIEKRE